MKLQAPLGVFFPHFSVLILLLKRRCLITKEIRKSSPSVLVLSAQNRAGDFTILIFSSLFIAEFGSNPSQVPVRWP